MAELTAERTAETSGRVAVCHVASGDRWAGAEVQVATLLRALAGRPDLTVSALLLNEGRLAQEARDAGIEVTVIPESRHSFFAILRQATQHLRGRGVAILHSHRYKENLLAALLARRCQVPFLVRSQHGLPEPFTGLRNWKQQCVQLVDRAVARYATDRLIGVSAGLGEHLRQIADARKVVVIENGIEPSRVTSRFSPAEAKARLGFAPECRVVGTAGRLDPVKRLDLFLEAAKRVAAQVPDMRFVIAGEGTGAKDLRDMSHSLGLDSQVVFTGHRDDVYDVLRAMDVFLLCSDHEGLPMVLLEALCLGVPVVARPVGGVTEVLEHEKTGILVEGADPDRLAEACVRLLSDTARCVQMSAAGRSTVERRFHVQAGADAVASLYLELCRAR